MPRGDTFCISFSLDSLEVPEQPRASQSQDPKDTNCRFVVSSVVSLVLLPENNFKVHAKPRARTQKTGPTCYRKPVAQFSDARLMSNEFREHMYIRCSLVLHARQSPRGKFQKRSVFWLSELHTAVLKGVVLRKHSATVWDAWPMEMDDFQETDASSNPGGHGCSSSWPFHLFAPLNPSQHTHRLEAPSPGWGESKVPFPGARCSTAPAARCPASSSQTSSKTSVRGLARGWMCVSSCVCVAFRRLLIVPGRNTCFSWIESYSGWVFSMVLHVCGLTHP